MLVDTHCHLGDPAFAGEEPAVLARAAEAGVGHVVVIGESPGAAAKALALAESNPRVSATAGLHPHHAELWDKAISEWLVEQLREPRIVAAGEMGLDYHYDNAPRDRQRVAFEAQLALAASVGKPAVVVIGESPEAAAKALALAESNPRVSATAGLHPHHAELWDKAISEWLVEQLREPRIVAAGEMGLDYHYDNAPRDRQRVAFEAQLALAASVGKPAVVHAREADDDVAALLRNQPFVVAILHSFSSSALLLETGIELGHYFSFSGMVTFRSWDHADLVRQVPRDRLLLETDAPYLAPVPYRGKRNEPAYVIEVAKRLARVLELSVEELARLTTENAERVFGVRVNPFNPTPYSLHPTPHSL